jgi:hypothetical protein
MRTLFLLFFAVVAAANAADDPSPNAVRAGVLAAERPTLNALGLEWPIEGDDNRNAVAELRFRVAGAAEWRDGLPLFRLQNEQILTPPFTFTTPNMFAGSVFDLEPGTTYEVQLTLEDPDGVSGNAKQSVQIRTRAEPEAPSAGRIFHVYPPDHKGERQSPAFTGLLAAYYQGSAHADWSNSFPPRVQPGDTVLVHAGLYKDNRWRYGGGMGTVFDGTYHLTSKGTAEKPIAIRAAGDGEVIFDGDGAFNLFDVLVADHHYFEGITVRNTDIAFQAGTKSVAGAKGLTIRRSRFEDVGIAVITDFAGSTDFYIADNTMIGRHDPKRLVGWVGRTWEKVEGFPAPVSSNFAVKVYGQGHVVAHNYIAHFHDGVSHATHGVPDSAYVPASIDIVNNDIFNSADNCIEVDGGMHNIRVLGNRRFNHAHRALSAQPLFGGPAYFVRNIVYHSPEGGSLKLHATPAGVLFYHNTLIGEVHNMGPASNIHFRNNLVVGQGAFPEVFDLDTFTNYSSSDYNGFRPNIGAAAAFGWSSPPFAVASDYKPATSRAQTDRPSPRDRGPPLPHREIRSFKSLREYSRATGQDTHSVLIDFADFVRVTPPDPKAPTRLYVPADFDFGLTRKSKAIDVGTTLPNINDGFRKRAPDLGALEQGSEPPHYGPRKTREEADSG